MFGALVSLLSILEYISSESANVLFINSLGSEGPYTSVPEYSHPLYTECPEI